MVEIVIALIVGIVLGWVFASIFGNIKIDDLEAENRNLWERISLMEDELNGK